MRRRLLGVMALAAVTGSLMFSAPARSDVVPPIPAPCGGPMPCGGPDEKVAELVDRVVRLCPGNVCPRP